MTSMGRLGVKALARVREEEVLERVREEEALASEPQNVKTRSICF